MGLGRDILDIVFCFAVIGLGLGVIARGSLRIAPGRTLAGKHAKIFGGLAIFVGAAFMFGRLGTRNWIRPGPPSNVYDRTPRPRALEPRVALIEAPWKRFHSASGKFSILMPREPRETPIEPNPDAGVEGGSELFLESGDRIYVAFSTRFCDEADDPTKIFDDYRDDIVAEPQVQVREEVVKVVDGFPAREFLFTGPDGFSQRSMIVVAGRTIYQVIGEGALGFARDRQMNDFFESFTIEP